MSRRKMTPPTKDKLKWEEQVDCVLRIAMARSGVTKDDLAIEFDMSYSSLMWRFREHRFYLDDMYLLNKILNFTDEERRILTGVTVNKNTSCIWR